MNVTYAIVEGREYLMVSGSIEGQVVQGSSIALIKVPFHRDGIDLERLKAGQTVIVELDEACEGALALADGVVVYQYGIGGCQTTIFITEDSFTRVMT